MINCKQFELSQQLFNQLQQRYPDVALVDIVESGVYPNHIWVRMVMPADEDKEIEVGKLASELSTDILLDYVIILPLYRPCQPGNQVGWATVLSLPTIWKR